MTKERYPKETLDKWSDNGTMPESKEALAKAVVGHRIVKAQREDIPVRDRWYSYNQKPLVLTLDNGSRVILWEEGDCCAFTEVGSFMANVEMVDHVIIGVGTTGEYTKWHIYADLGDMLELTVDWSCGNPFYYGYGFDIEVRPLEDHPALEGK